MRVAVYLAAVAVLLAACGPDVAYTPTVASADASDVPALPDTAVPRDTAAEDAAADVSEVYAGCIVSADCPGKTEQCLSGACVALACKPGVANCADVATVATCKADGSGWDTAGCDDGNPCTDDGCKDGGCTHANADNVACDLDATNCTPDVCKSGTCTKGLLLDCNDNNPCTSDSCIPNTGLCAHVNLADGSACEDGDACTLADTCLAGACKSGAAKVCSGTAVCVAGVCKVGTPDGMALIPAGSFKMGCVPGDFDCYSGESPQHTVMLHAYYMDVYEVTVAKYKACVDAGKCTAPKSGGSYYNWGKSGREQHPVNGVTWFQSDAYCKWTDAKAHLPTEAQWEKAARGGLDGKKYPWGDANPTCTPGQSNTAVWYGNGYYGCGTGYTWPIGTGSGKNGYGVYDMAGNVWEWAADWYGSSYYGSSPASNPAGPGSGSDRVGRGGGFDYYDAGSLRASRRGYAYPSYDDYALGFRCSRSIP